MRRREAIILDWRGVRWGGGNHLTDRMDGAEGLRPCRRLADLAHNAYKGRLHINTIEGTIKLFERNLC